MTSNTRIDRFLTMLPWCHEVRTAVETPLSSIAIADQSHVMSGLSSDFKGM